MNRKNVLEKHILTRCYSNEARIAELLSERYSIKGNQKPILILTPTGEDDSNERQKSLLHKEIKKESDKDALKRKANTRIELKAYIKTILNNQKKLIKKIQAYNRKLKTQPGSKKPFQINQLLEFYNIPLFEDFISLNELWQSYMQKLLFNNSPNPSSYGSALQKLSSADFIGCLITVIQSVNNSLVGMRGIVVWDAQHSFIVCSPRCEDSKEWNENKSSFSPSEQVGGFKVLNKKGSIFGFDVILPQLEADKKVDQECIGFSIIGSRFEFRSVDRTNKKFKNHEIETIL